MSPTTTTASGATSRRPSRPPPLHEIPPEPVDDETRPLLDASHPSHGTITAQQAALEDRAAARAEDVANLPGEPSTGALILTMGPLYCAAFFAAADSTIVATLASPISASLRSSTLLSWLAAGYLLANAAFQPLSGRLSDIYGRRAGILFAVTFFAIGTAMCGASPSAGFLIAGRLVAGAGGGCINTMSTFIGSDLIPLRKRGLWQGYANVTFGTGLALGGVFGGWMHEHYSWRWAFYIQLPFIVASGIVVWWRIDIPVKESDESKISRVDFAGAITLSSSLVLLLLGLNSGGNIVPWNHPLVYVSLPLSALSLAAFVYIETRVAAEPIIPVQLLLHRTVWAALLTNWFGTMVTFAIYYYTPIYFSVVQHLSATQTGIHLVPMSASMAVGSLGAGILMRATGRYRFLIYFNVLAAVAAATLLAVFFRPGLPDWPPYLIFALHGVAYGSMLTVTLLALLSAVSHKNQAVITSASYAFRSTGSTIGVTLSSAVFQNILNARLWAKFGQYDGAKEIIARLRDDITEVGRLGPRWRPGVEQAYADALRGVWGMVVALAVCGAITNLLMREHVLHKTLERQ